MARRTARRGENLLGAAVVIAFMRDVDDDRRLAVVPAVGGGASRLAEKVERAPSAATLKRVVMEPSVLSVAAIRLADSRREARTVSPHRWRSATPQSRLRLKRRDLVLVLHVMWRVRFARLDIATEAPGNAGRVASALSRLSVTTMSRIGCTCAPAASQTADRLEQPPRRQRRSQTPVRRHRGFSQAPDRQPSRQTTSRAPAAAGSQG